MFFIWYIKQRCQKINNKQKTRLVFFQVNTTYLLFDNEMKPNAGINAE